MPERGSPRPDTPESGRDLEWNVPASLATKHAVVTAVNHLVPEGAPGQEDGLPFDTNAGELEIMRLHDTGAPQWALHFLPRPRHPAQPRIRGDESVTFITGSDRVAHPVIYPSASYRLGQVSEDEITLTKIWTGVDNISQTTEVSEGEAQWLVNELVDVEEGWPDAYESGGETPDYYADR